MVHRKNIIFGGVATGGFLALGTSGYALIENYSLLDAFYMTVITITTVGYAEVHPLSAPGRIFTIFLILFGFGSIGFLAHAFTEVLIERAASGDLGKRTMRNKISQLYNHVIICGFGRVGEAAAEHFASTGSDFVVIETSAEQLKLLEDYDYLYLEADATREESLLSAGIKKASALVALLDSDPDNLFTVLTARELNPTLHIIARTEVPTSESRLLRAGADGIVSPYAYAGRKVAKTVLESALPETGEEKKGQGKPETDWLNVTQREELSGHTVENVEKILARKIIGIRRDNADILCPAREEEILLEDRLYLGLAQSSFQESCTIAEQRKKIVLIDNNPVIRRLYTRLFQKAGFHLFTAATGEEGYSLLQQQKPDAAVVDFELPDLSGLELCRRIRENHDYNSIKLFLFTANDDEKTREVALLAGVDTVVVKSPEAGEIVNIVQLEIQRS